MEEKHTKMEDVKNILVNKLKQNLNIYKKIIFLTYIMTCNTQYKIIPNKKFGEGAQGAVYLTVRGKKEYLTKNPVSKKELELSKLLQSIGPKIYDDYECKTLEQTKNVTKDGTKLKLKGKFIVMEKLIGLDLNDYIQEEGIFIEDDDKLISILMNKINKLHKLGYYHNDLTTSNVFIVYDKINQIKDVKIIDFGNTKKLTKKGEQDDYKTLYDSLNTFGSHVLDNIQPLLYELEDKLEKYKPKKKSPVKKKTQAKKQSIKKVIPKLKAKKRVIKIKKIKMRK